jgi:heat shock protein HtpX
MNQVKTILLLGSLSALLILIGSSMGSSGMWLFGGIAVLMNIGAYFFSDKVVLAINRARPLAPGQDPALETMVSELAQRASIPTPRIYLVEDPSPNAFATGRNPAHGVVAVTTGIRDLLSDRELRGVIAHEMAHIRNRDILIASIAAMIASAVAMIATAIRWGALFGGFGASDRDRDANPIVLIAMSIVAPLAATVIQLAISRTREYGADAYGARISGDPLALASALGKLEEGTRRRPFHTRGDNPATASLFICNPFSGKDVMRWFSTHPPIPERIARLQAMAR